MNLCVNLKRGKLDVAVRESLFAPDALFGFAERKNPKRAFLFVSKVLGRHIPVKPSVMQQTYENLAAQVPTDLPGPVIVFGMAETAVGLGAGVHRALQSTRDDTFYLVSSRHDLGTPIFARFEEEHSHASAHLIHMPADAQIQAMLKAARSIVLVDDEASTGKTFINLLASLESAGLSNIEKVVTVTLTDWSDNAVQKAIGPKATSVSLLSGSYAFTEDLNAPLPDMPDVSTTKAGVWPINPRNDWGRLGAVRHQDLLKLKTMPGPDVVEEVRYTQAVVIPKCEDILDLMAKGDRRASSRAEVHFNTRFLQSLSQKERPPNEFVGTHDQYLFTRLGHCFEL